MAPHFGPNVTGEKEYDRAVRNEKGGANVFGARVRGAIPEDGPTNIAKRVSEFGVAVLDGAHGSDVKGKPAESVSIDQLKNILAENPTFLDSLYEAELARADGARPDALAIFYEVERGIKGQMREDVMREIRGLLGQKGIDAAALADRAKAHRIQIEEQRQRTEENAQLGDADRLRALRQREDDLKIVREGQSASGRSQMVATDTEGQLRAIAEREGLDISGGENAGSTASGKVPTKPEGDVHPESQSPGNRLGVPKGTFGSGDEGSSGSGASPDDGAGSEEGEQDFEKLTKADLEDYLGDDLDKVKGTGANDAVLKDDLVKAAKRKQKRDAKQES